MTETRSRTLKAGDDLLRIPFVVNVKGMPESQLDELMDGLAETLGAEYFRDKTLTLEVLQDRIAAAQKPRSFLYGPYLKVAVTSKDELRITTADEPQGGETVYAVDQITAMLQNLSHGAAPKPARPAGAAKPKM